MLLAFSIAGTKAKDKAKAVNGFASLTSGQSSVVSRQCIDRQSSGSYTNPKQSPRPTQYQPTSKG